MPPSVVHSRSVARVCAALPSFFDTRTRVHRDLGRKSQGDLRLPNYRTAEPWSGPRRHEESLATKHSTAVDSSRTGSNQGTRSRTQARSRDRSSPRTERDCGAEQSHQGEDCNHSLQTDQIHHRERMNRAAVSHLRKRMNRAGVSNACRRARRR